MSPETKKQALEKLSRIDNKIGYPDKWRDYSSLNIVRGDAMGNSARANQFEFNRQLNKIGKPVDRSEWEHDSAHGERVLQSAGEQREFPRWNSPAAVL